MNILFNHDYERVAANASVLEMLGGGVGFWCRGRSTSGGRSEVGPSPASAAAQGSNSQQRAPQTGPDDG